MSAASLPTAAVLQSLRTGTNSPAAAGPDSKGGHRPAHLARSPASPPAREGMPAWGEPLHRREGSETLAGRRPLPRMGQREPLDTDTDTNPHRPGRETDLTATRTWKRSMSPSSERTTLVPTAPPPELSGPRHWSGRAKAPCRRLAGRAWWLRFQPERQAGKCLPLKKFQGAAFTPSGEQRPTRPDHPSSRRPGLPFRSQ